MAAAQTLRLRQLRRLRGRPVCGSAAASAAPQSPVIRFEDASDKAGIDFTHSFGSRQLGSLLEGTGAGCVWFDYNNSGLESLYVVNGRPLDDSMHPYPLKEKPTPPPHNHLYRNNGNGTLYRCDGEGRPQSGYVWDGRDGGRL